MKLKVFFSLMFLIVSTVLYVSNTTAENEPYTQWGLPEGAKARFGKGGINDITCTTDGALLAVASQIGIWIYDVQTAAKNLPWLTGNNGSVDRVAFSPDGRTLASGWSGQHPAFVGCGYAEGNMHPCGICWGTRYYIL